MNTNGMEQTLTTPNKMGEKQNAQMQAGLPPYVSIGAHSYAASLQLHRWGNEEIRIGKYCSISQMVKLLAGGNHRTDLVTTFPLDTMIGGQKGGAEGDRSYVGGGKGIEIKNDVWIGYGATIVGNVTVGNGAVIAAEAVVFSDIPDYAIAVGNPARVNKFRFPSEVIEELLRIAWWDWEDALVAARRDWFYRPVHEFVQAFGYPKKHEPTLAGGAQ